MVRYGAGGETGRWIVKLMAAPWNATAATMLMCWLLLVFETASRGGAKTKIRWVEMTGQYTARLWPLAVLGSIAIPLAEWLRPDTLAIVRWYAWPVALLLAWFPFTALRSNEAGEIHTVCRVALQRWGSGALLFLGWLSVAGVWLLAFHLLREWLVSLCPDNTWYRTVLAGLLQTVWVLPAVWLLGAWVAMQVDKLPAPGKQRRSHS